ncbi:hypothetical protein PSHT_03200, partial [Puccinia striiformis]
MIKLLAIKVGHFQLAKNDGIGAKRIPSWDSAPNPHTSSNQRAPTGISLYISSRGKLHITEHHSYLGRLQVINFSDLRQVLFQTCPRDEPSDLRQIPLLPGRPLGWCQNFRPVREMSPHQIVYISNQLCQFGLSPKEFITGFLTRDHPQLIYRRRTWGTDHGARSTIALVVIIRNLFHGNHGATGHWDDLIQAEPISTKRQLPRGIFPKRTHCYPGFFLTWCLDDRRKRLTLHDTPFLFNLVVGALARPANDQLANNELSAEPANPAAEVSSDGLTPEESEELEVEGDVYSTVMSGRADCQARSRH